MVGEKVLHARALAFVSQDKGLVSITNVMAHCHLKLQFQGIQHPPLGF